MGDVVRDEVTAHLRDLIRFDTTNPAGNETPCVEHIATVLRRGGIDSVLDTKDLLAAELMAMLPLRRTDERLRAAP